MEEVPPIRVYKPQALVLDFVGTVVRKSWFEGGAEKYFLESVEKYVTTHHDDLSVKILIQNIRAEREQRRMTFRDAPEIADDEDDVTDIAVSLKKYLLWFARQRSKKVKCYSDLVMRILFDGLANGELKVEVYEEMPRNLAKWRKDNIKIYVDGPELKRDDLLLYLQHTTMGDLRELFDVFLASDFNSDSKSIEEDYRFLFNSLEETKKMYVTMFGPKALLFLNKLGVDSIVLDRDDARKNREVYAFRFAMVPTLDDIEFVNEK